VVQCVGTIGSHLAHHLDDLPCRIGEHGDCFPPLGAAKVGRGKWQARGWQRWRQLGMLVRARKREGGGSVVQDGKGAGCAATNAAVHCLVWEGRSHQPTRRRGRSYGAAGSSMTAIFVAHQPVLLEPQHGNKLPPAQEKRKRKGDNTHHTHTPLTTVLESAHSYTSPARATRCQLADHRASPRSQTRHHS
jgi:hypothetical protein